MSRNIELKEGAFIVADAHYSYKRPELLDFFEDIYAKRLKPTQLILMGDVFDALFGGIPHTYIQNDKLIKLINTISLEIEVIYLEGNHDFNLKKIFTNSKVYAISQQPIECRYGDKKILLAHGDIESPFMYRLYTSLIRNPSILFFLNIFDTITSHLILNNLDKHLQKKDDCKEFVGLKEYMSKRLLGKYRCDYFIEGHYHQNKTIDFDEFIYINLGAFACNQRYFIVKSLQEAELLQENSFS